MTAVRGHITRTGAYSYQISEGQQAYVPPVVPPTVESKQITVYFPADSSNYWEFIRFQFAADVDFADASLSNVATVTYYKNGSAVSGNQSFAVGDEIAIEITRTSPAADASVLIDLVYDSTTDNFTVPDYKYATWTNLVAMSVDTDTFLATNRGLLAAVNGTDTFDKGANSVESFSGVFTVEIDSLTLGSLFGIATTNNSGPSLNRPLYAWYCQANNLLQMRVNGGFIATAVSVPRNNSMRYSLRIVDTGSAIEFWYKPPSGIWTLNQTTTTAYVAGTTYYADIVSSIDAQKSVGVKIYP